MAKVINYLPEVKYKFICSKGGLHAEQPLSLVCLDPLCRNDPLACSICFIHIHKHHKVISVDKFVDDYTRNVYQKNGNVTLKKIERHHKQVRQLIDNLRQAIAKELDSFEESIDEYADEMRAKMHTREYISKLMNIPLQPGKLRQSKSNTQFVDFLKFVLNNSLFDSNNNMAQIADILKHDEQRIYALLDKMVNMTENCQEYIKEVMKNFKFADQTIKLEKVSFKEKLSKINVTQNQFSSEEFEQREKLNRTLHNTIALQKQHWHKQLFTHFEVQPSQENDSKQLKFTFSQKMKHNMIEIKEKSNIGVSNITALKPQYALLTPHLNTKPTCAKQWTLKISNCRNFASQNTLAIGLATQKDLRSCNYQGHHPNGASLLTSQGFVIQNGRSRKTNVVFGTGDTLHCKFDPYYKLFEITKENGRKLTLKVDRPQDEQLFICVRLTYASDQVQIL